MPPFVTYQDFLKLPGSKGSRTQGGYKRYKTWVSRTRSKRANERLAKQGLTSANQAWGPYRGQTPAQIAAEAARLFPVASPAALRGEASRSVSAQINPLIEHLQRTITGKEHGQMNLITAATGAHAERLKAAAPEVANIYGQAQTQQAAIDAGLRSQIEQSGKVLGAGMENLTAAGLGTAGQQAVGQLAAGGGLAQAGYGSIGATQLAGERAGAVAHAENLPDYARLEGQAAANAARRQFGAMLAEGIGEYRAQVPGLVEKTFGALQDRNTAMRTGRAGILTGGRDRALQAQIARAGLAQEYTQTATTADTAGQEIEAGTDKPQKGDFADRFKATRSEAIGLAGTLRQDKMDPTGTRKLADYVPLGNAYKRVSALYRSNFPGMSPAWVKEQSILALVSGGYVNARKLLPLVLSPSGEPLTPRKPEKPGKGKTVTKGKGKPKPLKPGQRSPVKARVPRLFG